QRFTELLKNKISQLKVGPYTEKDVDFGPVITKESKGTIIRSIDEAVTEGANLVIDGRNPRVCETSNGFYLG
ncbi:aldehyde dehydrogenase family protein, partial [Lysinibacillus fusiformis]|uniref:aldehyde dehydrogenase family protein n=1 Tax=Lysinibacillus fusiformis TaxID=28031 RepID=UPI00201C0ADE